MGYEDKTYMIILKKRSQPLLPYLVTGENSYRTIKITNDHMV